MLCTYRLESEVGLKLLDILTIIIFREALGRSVGIAIKIKCTGKNMKLGMF